jgi:hypothetical protein
MGECCSCFTGFFFAIIMVYQIQVNVNAYHRVVRTSQLKARVTHTQLLFSPPKESATDVADKIVSQLEVIPASEAKLNTLLESMPVAEKYALLLQSYASNILDSTNRTVAALDTMESLFAEMLSKSISPSEKSSKLLIDAASTFCSSMKLGKSLQLAKAGKNDNNDDNNVMIMPKKMVVIILDKLVD